MPTKIETSLPPAELHEFFAKAAAMPGGGTGPALQKLAAEYGVTISHNSANELRKGAFAEYLEELRRKREMAESVTAIAANGLGISDASASMLSERILSRLLDAGDSLSDEQMDQFSLAISRLRTGDQRAKYLEARVAEMESKAAEREERAAKAKAALEGLKSKGGLTKETLQRIEEAAGLL